MRRMFQRVQNRPARLSRHMIRVIMSMGFAPIQRGFVHARPELLAAMWLVHICQK
jgi:hypothetical protein